MTAYLVVHWPLQTSQKQGLPLNHKVSTKPRNARGDDLKMEFSLTYRRRYLEDAHLTDMHEHASRSSTASFAVFYLPSFSETHISPKEGWIILNVGLTGTPMHV